MSRAREVASRAGLVPRPIGGCIPRIPSFLMSKCEAERGGYPVNNHPLSFRGLSPEPITRQTATFRIDALWVPAINAGMTKNSVSRWRPTQCRTP